MTLAALGVAALAVPLTAGAATGAPSSAASVASHANNTLRVCISGLRGREAEIDVSGNGTFRSKDNDGGCTFFRGLSNGRYRVSIDTPRRCDDASGRFRLRGGGTSTIRFDADCRSGGGGHDNDNDFDDEDFYVDTREECEDNGDDPVRTLKERDDHDDDIVLCRED